MSNMQKENAHGKGLVALLKRAGGCEPVLVIASASTVGRLALGWKESFGHAHWIYRVRSFGEGSDESEIEALAQEAKNLQAKTIAALGNAKLIQTVSSAAERIGVQICCFNEEP